MQPTKLAKVSPSRTTVSRTGSVGEKAAVAESTHASFTIRRQQDQLREESEKLDMLKKVVFYVIHWENLFSN